MLPILIDKESLQERILEMARKIRSEPPPYLLAVLEGALPFAREIARELGLEGFDTVKLSSYGPGRVSSGTVRMLKDLDGEVSGRKVVILEDIVDSGRTLAYLIENLRERGAESVEVHTLLSKPSKRVVEVPLKGVGFEIPDVFVVGYGMDAAGRYRDLPYIAVYDEATLGRQAQA